MILLGNRAKFRKSLAWSKFQTIKHNLIGLENIIHDIKNKLIVLTGIKNDLIIHNLGFSDHIFAMKPRLQSLFPRKTGIRINNQIRVKRVKNHQHLILCKIEPHNMLILNYTKKSTFLR